MIFRTILFNGTKKASLASFHLGLMKILFASRALINLAERDLLTLLRGMARKTWRSRVPQHFKLIAYSRNNQNLQKYNFNCVWHKYMKYRTSNSTTPQMQYQLETNCMDSRFFIFEISTHGAHQTYRAQQTHRVHQNPRGPSGPTRTTGHPEPRAHQTHLRDCMSSLKAVSSHNLIWQISKPLVRCVARG